MILFHHIPKTGGSTVLRALSSKMDSRRIPFGHSQFAIRKDSNLLLSSHWALAPDVLTPRQKADNFYFTWVRDPVEMFFSGWEYYRTKGKIHAEGPHAARPERLRQQVFNIVAARDFTHYLDNCECGADYFPLGMLPTNLSEFDFVGICEDMESELERLSELLNVSLRLPENRNESQKTINRDTYRDRVAALLI